MTLPELMQLSVVACKNGFIVRIDNEGSPGEGRTGVHVFQTHREALDFIDRWLENAANPKIFVPVGCEVIGPPK